MSRGPAKLITKVTALVTLFGGCVSQQTSPLDRQPSACSLGAPIGLPSLVVAPRRGTFYSVDSLNPDVVAFHGRFLMYFSGNDRRTPGGSWRTGLATSSSPNGPFRVQSSLEGNYLNGGTTLWHGRLWHLVEDNPNGRGELASSTNGLTWHHVAFLPHFRHAGTTYHGADFFLEPERSGLGVYMLAVPPGDELGRSLAFVFYARGRWTDFHIVLGIRAVARLAWSRADLGEPAVFYWGGMHYLLFVGLTPITLTRSIGLARESAAGWVVCDSKPAVRNGVAWGAGSSIDPSPLIRGNRLYLYYGATKTNGLAANLGGAILVRVYAKA